MKNLKSILFLLTSFFLFVGNTCAMNSADQDDLKEDSLRKINATANFETGCEKTKTDGIRISILTFQGFNEIDSLVAFRMLKWLNKDNWDIRICCPETEVTSMGGLIIRAQATLEDAANADAVVVGSGNLTRDIVEDKVLMNRISLDPQRQVIAAQCSGTLILAKLGLLDKVPACTDSITKPWVQDAGIEVLEQPFFAMNNVATAGGCLSAAYLTAWLIAKLDSLETAKKVLHYFAPIGEKDEFVERGVKNISPYLSY